MRSSGGWERVLAAACAVLTVALAQAQTVATAATRPTQATATSSSQSAPIKTTARKKSRKSRKQGKANWKKHGQQKIDALRTREIQDALIREHYLDGESSGVWNDATERAMQKYQGDNGWQSKMTPDARALIKLGLGPDQGKLLNPESAMTSGGVKSEPAPVTSDSPAPTSTPSVAVPASTPVGDPPRQ